MEEKPFIKLLSSPLNKYFYDVNKNQIVKISDSLYEFLKTGENDSEDENIRSQVDKLKSKGFLSSNRIKNFRHPQTDNLHYHLGENIAQITLQVTQKCNFRCSYCPYTRAEFNSNRSHGTKSMSIEVAKKSVDFFAQHSIKQNKVSIAFYGGEPFLEFDFVKRIVEYAEKQFLGKELYFTATTNGSLITDEILQFISNHNFGLLISLDGPPEVHNRSRKFAVSGRGTFEIIKKNLEKIINDYSKLIPQISINIVIDPRFSANNIHSLFSEDEILSKFRIQSTLIDDFLSIEKVNIEDDYMIEDSIHMFKAYASLIKKYPREKVSCVALNRIEASMQITNNRFKIDSKLPDTFSPSGPCIPGQKRLFINVDGDFFPCERVNEVSDVMKIGNIYDGFNFEKVDKLLNIGQLTEDNCRNCFAFRHCSICAKYCDNNGSLSPELKASNCQRVKLETLQLFREEIFKKEMVEEIEN